MRSTAVSLFAGVGGIDLALESAGFHVTSAVEINSAARGVLADRFPTTTLHDDVTKVSADELRADGFVPDRGVVAAGFPCQDLSVAGRRKGMGSGTRSGLYWHVVRLLAELRPRWVVLENVPGLLSATCICPGDERCQDAGHDRPCGDHVTRNKVRVWVDHEPHTVAGGSCVGGCIPSHGGVMGAVLGSLGDLGYGFAYRVLDAQHFGVPQRRRRVVIVGCLGDDRRPVEVLLEPEGGDRDPAAGDEAGPAVADDLGYGVGVPGRARIANTLTARDAKGPLPDQSLGNVVAFEGNGGNSADVAPTLTSPGPEGGRRDKVPMIVNALDTARGGPDDNAAQAGHLVPVTFQKVVRSGERDAEGNLPPEVWATRDVAATLNCGDNASGSRATELIVHARDTAATLTAGGAPNSNTPGRRAEDDVNLVVSVTGDKAHTLTAEGHDASEDGTGRGTPIVAHETGQGWWNQGDTAGTLRAEGENRPSRPSHLVAFAWQAGGNNDASGAIETDMTPTLPKSQTLAVHTETTVRRLTPRECERLQGFPDDWTATSNGKAQTDSPRYQQMGNAVAVPVFAWVARRMAASA